MDPACKESFQRKDTIIHLPMENVCWCITDNYEDYEGQTLRKMSVLNVTAAEEKTLLVSVVPKSDISYTDHVLYLFCHACFHPRKKRPRRPRYIKLGDTPDARAIVLNLKEFGVDFLGSGSSEEQLSNLITQTDEGFRRCFSCGLTASSDMFVPCSLCKAVIFCDENCQTEAMNGHHKAWCKKFKTYMEMEKALGNFPFTYTKDTTALDFNQERLRTFLKEHDVYDKGLWRRECRPIGTACTPVTFGDLQSDDKPYVLPLEDAVLAGHLAGVEPPDLDKPLQDWADYYSWRGFWLDSPVAGLLQYPLTLYWIVSCCLPKYYQDVFRKIKYEKSLHVHIIGAEKEAEMFTPFLECARLLASVDLHLHLFGDELSKHVHNKRWQKENLSFYLHQGLYHECPIQHLPKPDLVVGFNAGLSAYFTFMQTIQMILDSKSPLYCTDYCYYSIVHSRKALHHSQIGTMLKPVINPFRSPFRIVAPEMNLPRYSNAFVYHVKPFKDEKGTYERKRNTTSNSGLFASDSEEDTAQSSSKKGKDLQSRVPFQFSLDSLDLG